MKAAAVLFLAAFAAAARAGLPEDADARFSLERADAAAAEANRPADYAAAARLYSSIAADGFAGAAVLQNLGSCRLLSGDVRGAIEAYAAVERRTGETAETEQCVKAAYARLEDDPLAEAPFVRKAFRMHFAHPLRTRVCAAGWSWAGMWVFLLAGWAVRRASGRKAAAIPFFAAAALCALFFLAAGASSVVSLVDERRFMSSIAEESP